jgi:antitoxin (DNA-binding transcriptional repressor) of toxin-antitoxin stability system
MRPNEERDEPPSYSIRKFRSTMAARIDQGEVMAVTRRGERVGYYVPVDKPFPAEPGEIEREDAADNDDTAIVIATVTASDGPNFNVLRSTTMRLSLPELLGEDQPRRGETP